MKNLLWQLKDIEGPYKVKILPVGIIANAEMDRDGSIKLTRPWLNGGDLVIDHFKVAFPKLNIGENSGILTITDKDLADINHSYYEAADVCFDNPILAINSLAKTGNSGLTFWKNEINDFDNFKDVFDHLYTVIECGIIIDKLIVNNVTFDLLNIKLSSLMAVNSVPVISPSGRITRAVKGFVFSDKHGITYPYVGDFELPPRPEKVIVGSNGNLLTNHYVHVQPITTCPACGDPTSDTNGFIKCYNSSCSVLVESFLNSIHNQTNIPTTGLFNQFNSGLRFAYEETLIDDSPIIEEVDPPTKLPRTPVGYREAPVDRFRTLMDVVGQDMLMTVIKYVCDPKLNIYELIQVDKLISEHLSCHGNDVNVGSYITEAKVLIASPPIGITEQSLSLLLKDHGLTITSVLSEALFIIAGTETEFLSYAVEDTNKYVLVLHTCDTLRNLLEK